MTLTEHVRICTHLRRWASGGGQGKNADIHNHPFAGGFELTFSRGVEEDDDACRYQSLGLDSECLMRTLALTANGLMRGDPFAFVDWQHGSSELLLPARKSPELSVPNAHQLPETKRSEYSRWRYRLSLPPGILNFTYLSNQTLKDCVLCTMLAYD